MDKVSFFNREYDYIKNDKYRENAKILVNLLPDYFFSIPASSTGKYHPQFALGEAGLVRHTKVAVKIAHELLQNNTIGNIFTSNEKDLIIISLMLHDGLKSGLEKEKYTRVDHPLLVAQYIKDNSDKLTLTKDEIDFIASCIESHMGEWNKDFNGNEVLPLPKGKYQKFVHMCDFLASKKFLDVHFKDNDIIE